MKLVLHWMPNLLGATPEGDLEDFQRLWDDPALRPDEIKIYSTALLKNAELYQYWERGEYTPYPDGELLDLVIQCKERVPPYCRINRLYRDIPTTNIVAGCKMSNMRQQMQAFMRRAGRRCRCIRCREVRDGALRNLDLRHEDLVYETRETEERFLSMVDDSDRLAGYARLSLPRRPGFAGVVDLGIPELYNAALVRELHVYGPSLELGRVSPGRAQHRGLGSAILLRAEESARNAGYERLAIISSVGTRSYYARRGYERHGTYMVRPL